MPLPLAPLVLSALTSLLGNPETANKILNFVMVLVYITIAIIIFFTLMFIYFIYRMFFASDKEKFQNQLKLKYENLKNKLGLQKTRQVVVV